MQIEITIRSKIMREDIWKWSLYPILTFFQAINFYGFFFSFYSSFEWKFRAVKQTRVQHSWMAKQLLRIERVRVFTYAARNSDEMIKLCIAHEQKNTANSFEKQSKTVNHVCMNAWPVPYIVAVAAKTEIV